MALAIHNPQSEVFWLTVQVFELQSGFDALLAQPEFKFTATIVKDDTNKMVCFEQGYIVAVSKSYIIAVFSHQSR